MARAALERARRLSTVVVVADRAHHDVARAAAGPASLSGTLRAFVFAGLLAHEGVHELKREAEASPEVNLPSACPEHVGEVVAPLLDPDGAQRLRSGYRAQAEARPSSSTCPF